MTDPDAQSNLSQVTGFDWDEGNVNKNRLKHDVDTSECEEVFFNVPRIIFDDTRHSSGNEKRYRVLGISAGGRLLALAVTIRGERLRVIMARDQSRKERELFKTELNKDQIWEANVGSKKPIPQFENEVEEAQFWAEHDFVDFADSEDRVQLDFPNLKPSTQSVTVRLPKPLVRNLKVLANEQDIPYQSLLKMLLDEKVKERMSLKTRR